MLEVAPTAEAGGGIRARGRDAAGSGLEHLDGVGAHEAVAHPPLGDPRDDALTGQRVAHEDDLALVAGHAVTAVGHRPDVDGPLPADERLAAGRRARGSGARSQRSPRTDPLIGGSSIQSRSAPSDDWSCHGTLTTMTPGVKSSRALRRRALWLCSTCSHHFPRTYSGR